MDRVYVANLPPDIRIKDIDDFFSPFGKLVYIDVNNRSNPAYAYVQFDNARNAFNAVKSRHGYDYEGYTLQLRLMANEVRNRRDATPPPPPPPMLSNFERLNMGSGFRNNMGNNTRMGENFSNFSIERNSSAMFQRNANSSFQAKSNSMYERNTNSSLQAKTNCSFPANTNSQWSNNNNSAMITPNQNMIQYPVSNRVNMPQQNMDYSINRQQNMMQSSNDRSNISQQYNTNRSNILQQFSNTNSSDMQQQFSNTNRSDMPQYINSGRSNIQQHYSNSNFSNMSQQNDNYGNPLDMQQKNEMFSSNTLSNIQQLYSDTNYYDIPQQQMNMMNYCENSGNNSMNFNTLNDGNRYDNFGTNEIYNDPDAQRRLEDNFTRGLSGSGRKWFNRYIRQGMSPEMARAKALEHRTVPYLRDDPKNNYLRNDTNNAALETVGNTIMSLLQINSGENMQQGYLDKMGVINKNPVPRSSMALQSPRNLISKRQYLRSVDVLKSLRSKRVQSAQDRLSKKHHVEIVRNYERFERKNSNKSGGTSTARNVRNDKPTASTVSQEKLEEKLRKKKGALLRSVNKLRIEQESKKRFGGAYKKRVKILMHEAGFSDLEAKSLALHPLEKLEGLIALKKEYDMVNLKTDFIPANKKSLKETPKQVVYRNDMKYVNMYKEHRVSNLSPRIVTALKECIVRIHNYEKEQKLPLTGGKFVNMLRKIDLTQKKQSETKRTSNAKKDNNTPSKKNDEKNIKNTEGNDKKREVTKENENEVLKGNVDGNGDDQENENITEDNQYNEHNNEDNEDIENIVDQDQNADEEE